MGDKIPSQLTKLIQQMNTYVGDGSDTINSTNSSSQNVSEEIIEPLIFLPSSNELLNLVNDFKIPSISSSSVDDVSPSQQRDSDGLETSSDNVNNVISDLNGRELSSTSLNTTLLDPSLEFSVQASRSQNSSRYGWKNSQCVANSAVFLCFLKEIENLTSVDLDLILDTGDALYQKIVPRGRRYLAADDLAGEIVIGRGRRHEIVVGPPKHGKFEASPHAQLRGVFESLRDEVRYALFFMRSLVVGVFRNRQGLFGFFDPHDRDIRGLIPGNKAVMIKFIDLNSMVDRIIQLHEIYDTNAETQFELTPLFFMSSNLSNANVRPFSRSNPIRAEHISDRVVSKLSRSRKQRANGKVMTHHPRSSKQAGNGKVIAYVDLTVGEDDPSKTSLDMNEGNISPSQSHSTSAISTGMNVINATLLNQRNEEEKEEKEIIWTPADKTLIQMLEDGEEKEEKEIIWTPADRILLESEMERGRSPTDSMCCEAVDIIDGECQQGRGVRRVENFNHDTGHPSSGEDVTPPTVTSVNPTENIVSESSTSGEGGGSVGANSRSDDDRSNGDIRVINRPRFNNTEIRSILRFPQPSAIPSFQDFYRDIVDDFQGTIERALHRADARENDYIQVSILSERLQDDVTMSRFYQAGRVTEFQNILDRLVQSNLSIFTDGTLEVRVNVVKGPSGGAKRRVETCLANEVIKKKARHIIRIINEDQRCFAVNLALLSNPGMTYNDAVRCGEEIHRRAGLSYNTPVGFADIDRFEDLLDCKIVVFYYTSDRDGGKKFSIFQTEAKRETTYYLFLHEKHFYGIKNVKGFLGSNYFCKYCYTGYQSEYKHFCDKACNVCGTDCKDHPLQVTYCNECDRVCQNNQCYSRHRELKLHPLVKKHLSNCQTVKRCPQCNRIYYISIEHPKKHVCSVKLCAICKQKTSDSTEGEENKHLCYMRKKTANSIEKINQKKIVFFDFETSQTTGIHIPVLVVAQLADGSQKMWYGHDCAVKFLLHFRQNKHRHTTFISHYGRNFDHHIILNAYVNQGISPPVIANGSKITLIHDVKFDMRFIDSFSFIPIPLRDFPKALGCKTQLKKGYFPHKFTDVDRDDYKGKHPPPEMYNVDAMTVKQREEFFKWYPGEDCVFEYKKELVEYCQNDVRVLCEGVTAFRNEFIQTTRCDPFDSITIASASLAVFQTNFLKANTIAIPAPDNYQSQYKAFSHSSIQWLEYEACSRNINIRHALNGGEVKLGPYHVDGYAVIDGLITIFSFFGCFFHGCRQCFNPHDRSPLTNRCFDELYSETMRRLIALQSHYNVQSVNVMWEHDWNLLKRTDSRVKAFLQCYQEPTPLNPREAFYGGRTEAICLRHMTSPNERVEYVDVTSLYPFVNATCDYPLGHPKIIRKDFESIENYFGLIHAKVYPPRGLFFPLLPFRNDNGKLIFTLCRLCASLNNQTSECHHNDEERALRGVWVSIELIEALKKGYILAEMYEVWHFEEKTNDLFRDFIFTFLKLKQEASGYPPGVDDDVSRLAYIADYKENQGIELDPQKIAYNATKRQIAKLIVNSLYGKLGQRADKLTTTLVSRPERFFEYLFSSVYEISHFHFINDDVALVQWRYNSKCVQPSGNANVFLAAFTTAYGRLVLYKQLDLLQERVLYADTDSCVYRCNPLDSYTPPLGNYLGDLTSELEPDDYICNWTAAGPKSYAYQTKKGKVVLKVKGITQNYENCKKINFDSLTELVENHLNNPAKEGSIPARYDKITRNMKAFELVNKERVINFSVVFDKRRLFPDGKTLPFGY